MNIFQKKIDKKNADEGEFMDSKTHRKSEFVLLNQVLKKIRIEISNVFLWRRASSCGCSWELINLVGVCWSAWLSCVGIPDFLSTCKTQVRLGSVFESWQVEALLFETSSQ